MKTIAVIGASGQVGTELCITLGLIPDVRVVAVCRSRLSSALLERCGICCRIGSLMQPDEALSLLSGCDAVFDLSLPRGPVAESRRINLQLIDNAVAAAAQGAPYVFASTYMALGIRSAGERLSHHLISKTTYGATKRIMERAAFAAGRKYGRDIYVLRLGQVHGEMQAVSRVLLSTMSAQKTLVPSGPSNTVFICSIAEGVASIAQGKETPGSYTMTSNPQWSWKELHAYFAARAEVSPAIVEAPNPAASPDGFSRMKTWATAFLLHHREFLMGYLLPVFPYLESKARAWHLIRAARAQIAQADSFLLRPYSYAYVGDAPGPRLKSPSDSRNTVRTYSEHVQMVLAALLR